MKMILKGLWIGFFCMVAASVQAAFLDLKVMPSLSTVDPGRAFSVDIMGSISPLAGFSNLDGGGVTLDYLPGVAKVKPLPGVIYTSSVPGVTYATPLLELGTTLDNTTGRVTLAFGNFAPSLPDRDVAAPGIQFLLATLDMVAGAPGSSVLTLNADPGNPFVHGFINEVAAADILLSNGTVVVTPLPSAFWLMLSAAGLMGLLAVRTRAGDIALPA